MEAGIVEDCGKFSSVMAPGLHCLIPCVQSLRSRVGLKIRHLEVMCDTKTKDNVFVRVVVAVQYKVRAIPSPLPIIHTTSKSSVFHVDGLLLCYD